MANAISRSNSTTTGYMVTYDANGGTVNPASQTVTDTLSYTFNKWKDSDNNLYNGGGTYTTNAATTMTATWITSRSRGSIITPIATRSNGTATRTVTFDAKGGTCSTASLDSTATVTYSANGWYVIDGQNMTRRCDNGGTYTPTQTETVSQQWASSTGTFSSITLPTPTRSGYIFLGWNEDPTASSGITGTYTPASNVILYAIWQLDREQARARIKQNGTWTKGYIWYNDEGEWRKVKHIYIKQNGDWEKGAY